MIGDSIPNIFLDVRIIIEKLLLEGDGRILYLVGPCVRGSNAGSNLCSHLVVSASCTDGSSNSSCFDLKSEQDN